MSLALIATIAAAVSAVGGLFATFAAFRSAGLAKSALEHSKSIEQRRTCDALVELAQDIKAEHAIVSSLRGKLEMEHRNHAGLTGTVHGSWLPQKLEALGATWESVAHVEERATEWAANYPGLLALDEEQAANLRIKLLADLARLRAIREDLRDQLSDVRDRNQLHREKVLSRVPGAGG